jgi:ribosomal protein L11 methyltransferase
LIRLAVRCVPELAEQVLAELTVLAPNGVEEERGPGYVEYAIYGGEGELPELGEIEVAAGDGLVELVSTEVPDDWADRWQDFHKPLLVGERLWLRPSWEEPREGAIDLVVDPGRAFGTGAHPTTRLCLELLLDLEQAGEAHGPLTDLGTGSGVLAIAAAKLGWDPVSAFDHEQASIEAAAENAAANDVSIALEKLNLREGLPHLAPTAVANLTAPVLSAIAKQLQRDSGSRGEGVRGRQAGGPGCRGFGSPAHPCFCAGHPPPDCRYRPRSAESSPRSRHPSLLWAASHGARRNRRGLRTRGPRRG